MDNFTRHQIQLDFFKKCLDYHKISYHTYSISTEEIQIEDLGIRHALGFPTDSLNGIKEFFFKSNKPNTLSFLTDELSCHYIVLPLSNTKNEKLFIIGPYITADESDTIIKYMSHPTIDFSLLPVLKKYYFQICSSSNEDSIAALVNTMADYQWGKNNYRIQYFKNGLREPLSLRTVSASPQEKLDLYSNIEIIEALYRSENELANAISHGQSSQARAIFANLPFNGFKYELDPLRNVKNFSIITNTIFRKAAEQGGVHPLYIDQLSTTFMIRIENMRRSDNIFELWTEMIQKYCSLVNNHNTRSYSLPIQKVITRINLDITADLSLKTTASYLKMNASYLSNLFKKETGYTLTNYVNKKRIEHAAFLLSTTTLPVSTIAQQCGILDDNYFTKLFRRHYSTTPSQFREHINSNL